MDHKKDLVKLFNSFGYKHDLYRVFSDFVELAALSISNSVDKQQFEKREEQYLKVIDKYTKDEAAVFPKMLGRLTTALEENMTDVLGEVFMELEISNKHQGQFFTPYSVAKEMAQMMASDYESIIKEKGYITVNEPAVGGGVTIIALAAALREKGYNFQEQMKVIAQDIDIKSVHMSYLQFCLLGIDAEVWRGNTLTYKFDSFWYTPMHVMNKVQEKRKEHDERMVEGMRKAIKMVSSKPYPAPKEQMQMSLF